MTKIRESEKDRIYKACLAYLDTLYWDHGLTFEQAIEFTKLYKQRLEFESGRRD